MLAFDGPEGEARYRATEQARKRAQARHAAIVKRARVDPVVFNDFVLLDEQTQTPIKSAPIHHEWQRFLTRNPWAVLIAPVEHGKAMPLNTEIPTPEGFRRLGDIRTGDRVFGRNGSPYRVTKVHGVLECRRVFRFRFDDGGTIESDLDHQWAAWTVDDSTAGPTRTVTTRQIVERGIKRGRDYFWKVPIADPVQYPEQDLPIHPYVFGVWLGDGTATNASITLDRDDLAIANRCLNIEGVKSNFRPDPRTRGVTVNLGGSDRSHARRHGLRGRLRALNVLGNKHIPDAYRTASVAQRLDLLAGLLDTDGSASRYAGNASRIEFGSVTEALARGVLDLVRSLGFKASMGTRELPATRTRPVRLFYRVSFTARQPVFWLERKLRCQILDGDRTNTRSRTIVDITEVDRQDTRCLTVDSPDHTFLAGRDYTVTHNTSQMVGRLLWEIGRNPSIRIAIISESEDQAKKVLGQIKQYIEESTRLKEVFPDLRRSTRKGHRWNELSIDVERASIIRDATVRAYGEGSRIVGSRLDLILGDDVLSDRNTLTIEQSRKVIKRFEVNVLTRAQDRRGARDKQGRVRKGSRARVWIIGTPWADHDLLHELERRPVFASRRFCAVENPDDKPSAWRPTWPEAWPLPRLFLRLRGMLPGSFARKYLCRVVNDINSRFPDWAIQRALIAGRGRAFLRTRPLVYPGPRELPCWSGVDIGIGRKEGNDRTAIVTLALMDDRRRLIVEILSGRWTADEIVDRIVDVHHRFGSRVVVESNAAQDFIRQFTRRIGKIAIDPIHTSAANKWSEAFGIESIAVELRQGLYVFPSGGDGSSPPDEMAALKFEMASYRPEAHTGDRLMALWFARERMRQSLGKAAFIGPV